MVSLSPGLYQHDQDSFVRVGDAPEVTRWHGTAQPEGTTIFEFNLNEGNPDGEYNTPSLGNAPALFTTDSLEKAIDYAYSTSHLPSIYDDADDMEMQVYELKLKPLTTVDLQDCEDDNINQRALDLKPDTIECPDFSEQPETVVLNSDIIDIVNVYKTDRSGKLTKIDKGRPSDYRTLDYARKFKGLPERNRGRGRMY